MNIRLLLFGLLFASASLAQRDIYGDRSIYGRLRALGQMMPPMGTTLPATCTAGEVFFDTDETPGLNWYGCTSTNTWTRLGGGGGTSITRTAVTHSATPTYTRSSAVQQWTQTLTGNVTSSTLSGASAGDLLSFEFTQDSTPRTVVLPTGFPSLALCATSGSVTVAQYFWTGSAAIERSVNSPGCTERVIRWQDGTTTTFPAGSDTAATLGGAQTFSGNKSFTGRLNLPNSTTRPATCTVGDVYFDTDATSGQRVYLCESTDTWVVQGGGGGGGGGKVVIARGCYRDGTGGRACTFSAAGGSIAAINLGTTNASELLGFRTNAAAAEHVGMVFDLPSTPTTWTASITISSTNTTALDVTFSKVCTAQGTAYGSPSADGSAVSVTPAASGRKYKIVKTLTVGSCAAGDTVMLVASTNAVETDIIGIATEIQ
jgi:hypothetical protein